MKEKITFPKLRKDDVNKNQLKENYIDIFNKTKEDIIESMKFMLEINIKNTLYKIHYNKTIEYAIFLKLLYMINNEIKDEYKMKFNIYPHNVNGEVTFFILIRK